MSYFRYWVSKPLVKGWGAAGVEDAEKDGVQTEPKAGDALEEVTEGTKQVSLQ
ncbi:hypothetical protein KC334_g10384, partial [Hortaea werneckii]